MAEHTLYTRTEVKDRYFVMKPLRLPKRSKQLAESELVRVLKKLLREGDPDPGITEHEKEMVDFIMDRIDDCYALRH